jgi:serine/threonine-protein kinase RsbW
VTASHHERAPAVPASVPRLRRGVERFAARLGARDRVLAAVRLAVSEALTNAVTHAYLDADTPGPLTVNAWTYPGILYIAVSDAGRGMKPRPDSPGIGLGLALIAQMADDVEVSDRPDRTGVTVRMRFALDGPHSALPAAAVTSTNHGRPESSSPPGRGHDGAISRKPNPLHPPRVWAPPDY